MQNMIHMVNNYKHYQDEESAIWKKVKNFKEKCPAIYDSIVERFGRTVKHKIFRYVEYVKKVNKKKEQSSTGLTKEYNDFKAQ